MWVKGVVRRAFPRLVRARRDLARRVQPFWDYLDALGSWLLPTKTSYSQDGEDALAIAHLSEQEITGGVYVDVGANHPMRLSNTYLLYRRGAHGIAVEPNRAFAGLYELFRPRDVFVCMGCAARYGLMPFYHHPVLHTLSSLGRGQREGSGRRQLVPVMPLDAILPIVGDAPVSVLSVDVEGFDLEVLHSGPEVLRRTRCVIVECGKREKEILKWMKFRGFEPTNRTAHNMIFVRRA